VLIRWDVAVAITTGFIVVILISFCGRCHHLLRFPDADTADDYAAFAAGWLSLSWYYYCMPTACCIAVLIPARCCCCHHHQLIAALVTIWLIVPIFPWALKRTMSNSYWQSVARPIAEVIARAIAISIGNSSFKSDEAAGHRIITIVLKEPITWTFPEAFAKAVAWTFPEAGPKKPSHRTLQEPSQEPLQVPSHVCISKPFRSP